MITTSAPTFSSCPYCGAQHKVEQCPRVKKITYGQWGWITSVEFWPEAG